MSDGKFMTYMWLIIAVAIVIRIMAKGSRRNSGYTWQTPVRTCSTCGGDLRTRANYCPRCGTRADGGTS